ncbi:MAG: hypothetical protein R3F31_05320 [Verrucomicrobiales bacterium]
MAAILVRAFRELQETRHLEITATAATHAVLPLLLQVPETVRAQISVGAETHEKTLRDPRTGLLASGMRLRSCLVRSHP